MSDSEENPVNWQPDADTIAQSLRPSIDHIEAIRQIALARRTKGRIYAGITAVVGVAIALIIFSKGDDNFIVTIIFLVIALVLAFWIYFLFEGGAIKAYRTLHKLEILAKAAAEVVPGIQYQPESMIPQSLFHAGGLFSSRIDLYTGQDYFKARVGSTDMLFSELHAQRKETSSDSKGRTTTHWVTVFKGIYLVADFHKDFQCWVKIEPDVAEASFGWIGRKMQGLSKNLVRLSNPEFERAFKVTSNDDLGAHYLLTPDMQERFLELRQRWSNEIRASLVDSCLHLAIPIQSDWFEPRDNIHAGETQNLQQFLNQLISLLHITETLDLNTRIWSKS